MADAQEQDTSVGGIADMLATTALSRAQPANLAPLDDADSSQDPTEDDAPDGGNADDGSTPDTDDPDGGASDEDTDEDDLDDEVEEGEDEEDEEDPGEEGEEDDYDEVTYSDDDLVEVTVDGETREVSLRDLKAAYSGEGAIDKRLKEATEARKEALSLRDTTLQKAEEQRTRLLQTVQALDGALFAPMVEKPDPALRASNMQQYLMQKDAYEEDQQRINTSRQQLAQFMQQQQQEQIANRQKYRNEQQQELVRKLPELQSNDPNKVKAVQDDIAFAASHYGFTPEQVALVDNHAVFLMARDAARYLRMSEATNAARTAPKRGNGKKPKKLRASGPTTAKINAKRTAQQNKRLYEKAKDTGKVSDVADLLSANAQARVQGKNHGRRR